MEWIYGIWTGICLSIVLVTFFFAPAWDNNGDGRFVTPTMTFAVISVVTAVGWLLGSLLIALGETAYELLRKGARP
jgi:hypothetical protein